MPKRTDDDYLRTTWWEDRDVEIRRHRLRMVTTRTAHRCSGNGAQEEHEIPAGTRVLYETGIFDNEVVSCWPCTDCMDAWLDEIEPLEYELLPDLCPMHNLGLPKDGCNCATPTGDGGGA